MSVAQPVEKVVPYLFRRKLFTYISQVYFMAQRAIAGPFFHLKIAPHRIAKNSFEQP